jgi:hypothetical protein
MMKLGIVQQQMMTHCLVLLIRNMKNCLHPAVQPCLSARVGFYIQLRKSFRLEYLQW